MAFALKTAASRALPLTKGQSRRQVAVRAGKYDEELMKTAVRGCVESLCVG